MAAAKSIKSAAKEAKLRLKSKFWEDYHKEVNAKVEKAEQGGLSAGKVVMYYQSKIIEKIRGVKEEDEEFYEKVKNLLLTCGKPANALDLLMDKQYFYSLAYNDREKYLFGLSGRYLEALDRFERESKYECIC